LSVALTSAATVSYDAGNSILGVCVSGESPEPASVRLRTALDNLEAAVERRLRSRFASRDAEAEFAMMQDDRARLAVELDAALDAQRALAEANTGASERIARAAGAIESWLGRAGG
jgi:hypothetical protein